MESKNRKKIIIVCCAFLVLLAAAGGGSYYYLHQTGSRQESGPRGGRPMQQIEGMDYVTASGTTSIGITEETFELEALDTELLIEEVYVSQGDTVEKGSRILKLSEESIEKARKELTRNATQTDLLYRQALIDYQLSLIEAQEAYDVSVVEAEYIESDYQASLQEAHKNIDDLTDRVADAKEHYEEYYNGVYNDSYREEYEIDEKKAAYEENEKLYWDTLRAWNIDDNEVNNSGGGSGPGGGSGGGNSGTDGSAAAADKQQRITALEMMEDAYRADKAAYEQALDEYQKAVETAHAGLEQSKAEYELLELQLEQAMLDYEKQAAVCRADYETKLSDVQNALSTYETERQRLDEELASLEDDREEAAENLSIFEEAIGDGCLYTSSKGTVVMVAVSKEDKLEPDSIVLVYSDPTILTVTAAVDQSDIAQIEIGEQAVVVSADSGNFEAQVTRINPVAGSGSRASVSYAVTLSFTKDAEMLSANETVTVCFGISPAEYEEMQERLSMPQNGMTRSDMSQDGMPDGDSMQDGMPGGDSESNADEMPGRSEMPGGGNRTDGGGMPGNGGGPGGFGMP